MDHAPTKPNESSPVIAVQPLGFPWATFDPFLFCVHHLDHYPAGNGQLGPQGSLAGRDLGHDFAGRDGWRMYHGERVPGFPQHPHRGFETVTVTRRGYVDHADSLGAVARYGEGDVQWLTAGAGILHAEMFPLLHSERPNPLELFQIWLNLPAPRKMVDPYFKMFWSPSIPRVEHRDESGRAVAVTVIAGPYGDLTPLAPPPDSWASDPRSNVAIWTARLDEGATWNLPPGPAGVHRTAYLFEGDRAQIASEVVAVGQLARLQPDAVTPVTALGRPLDVLVLQGRPIGEPVVQYGPFVMNTRAEIAQAMADYQRTQFGGWPWPDDAPVHGPEARRFARHRDGRSDTPPT